MIWCYFTNRGAQNETAFAIRASACQIYCIIGSTIPT